DRQGQRRSGAFGVGLQSRRELARSARALETGGAGQRARDREVNQTAEYTQMNAEHFKPLRNRWSAAFFPTSFARLPVRGITAWLMCVELGVARAGCVTITVYCPAAAAEKADDRIIYEVWQLKQGAAPVTVKPAPGEAK